MGKVEVVAEFDRGRAFDGGLSEGGLGDRREEGGEEGSGGELHDGRVRKRKG